MKKIALHMFAEDFDAEAMPDDAPFARPEVDPGPDQLERTRMAGWRDGYAAGHAAGLAQGEAEAQRAARQIAQKIEALAERSLRRVDGAAQALAELLLGVLDRAFPILCRKFGATEISGVAKVILPSLDRMAHIEVTVAPEHLLILREQTDALDKRLAEKIKIIAHDRCGSADILISWPNGDAVRDGCQIWDDITATLQLQGLTFAPIAASSTKRELVDVE